MLDFVARRLVAIVPVLTVVAILVFLMLRLTPGDPAAVIAGDNATSDQIDMIREKLGLNLPIWQQFGIWIGDVLRGNFGESYFFKKTVVELINQRIEPTLALSTCALVFAIAISVPIGVLAAYRQGSLFDRVVMGFSVMGFSVPGFVIAYCLIYVFAIWLSWLPVQGYVRIGVDFWGFLEHMVLPTVTLSVGFIALISRITRASVLEVLNEDYIRTARAKGLSNRVVLMRHALRNAAVPILTVIGIGIAIVIGGSIITESVFGLPGVGRLTVEAVLSRDFPTIQAVILMFSVVYVVVNLLIDISYTLFDPRIRY
jgi:peptide/nickel transport system permease protein